MFFLLPRRAPHVFIALILVMLACFTTSSDAGEKGLFWRAESPTGITSYLFGTMHTDDNRIAQFSSEVTTALQQVDLVMTEVEQSRDSSLLMLKQGSLAQYITNEEFEQVRELADFHVMHLGAAMQMKPWLLAVIFDLPKPQTPFAQDNLLVTQAEDYGKQTQGIETPKEHFGVMDDFTIDEQLIMLRAVLKRTKEQKEKDFERLVAAYLKEDAASITKLDESITGGMLPSTLWNKMRQKLLDDRNIIMSQRTLAIANNRPVFIAVGASHLSGNTGLLHAYREAGYKLTVLPMR